MAGKTNPNTTTGNTPSNTSRSSTSGGNKWQKVKKKGAGRGREKRTKTTATFERGINDSPAFSIPLLSLFYLSFIVPLCLDLHAPLPSSPSFFSKRRVTVGRKQLHSRNHRHPFYFSSTTATPHTTEKRERERERGRGRGETHRGDGKAGGR